MYALSILNEARKLEIQVPDELQIVGYDNSAYSTLSYPQLSTIDQKGDIIGQSAATLLLDILKDPQITSRHINIDVCYIERETTQK